MSIKNKEISSLRARIENYKQTRSWSRGAMIEWCDALISAAEAELDRLASAEQKSLDSTGTDHIQKARSTYPFDGSSWLSR